MRTLRCIGIAMTAVLIVGALASCGSSSNSSASSHERATANPAPAPAFTPQQSSFGASSLTTRPLGSESVIAQTSTPAVASLALRFQPTVRMSIYDRFWPVSVAAAIDETANGRDTCLVEPPAGCVATPPKLSELMRSGLKVDYLRYPANKLNAVEEQFRDFAAAVGVSPAAIAQWRSNPAALNPYASAQLYFYDAGNASYHYKGAPPGLTSLQYWFFYAYNYYPTAVNPFSMDSRPLESDDLDFDHHEGDWEHITVLLNAQGAPAYLWMARHADEGEAIPWSRVQTEPGQSTHAIVYPAFGGHPSYQSCGAHRRKKTLWVLADYVACPGGLFTFSFSTTPLVDLAHATWACWPGHFGIADPKFAHSHEYLVDGPVSPFRQAEDEHVCSVPGIAR